MAKGDVTMKFDAQTAAFVAAVNKARDAMDQGADKARKFGAETVKAGDQASQSMRGIGAGAKAGVADIMSMGAAMISLQGIVSKAGEAMQAFSQDQAKFAKMAKDSTGTLLGPMAATGQLGSFTKFRDAISSIGSDTIKHSDLETITGQLITKMGKTLSHDDAFRAAKAAVAASNAGFQVGDAANFATTVAQLGTVPGLKDMPDNDLNELAFGINTVKTGGLSEQDLRFIKRDKKNPLHALDLVLAAARSQESAKGLEALEEIAGEDIDPMKIAMLRLKNRKHPHPLGGFNKEGITEDEARLIRLSEIDPDDRLSAIERDPTLAPQSKRRVIGNLKSNVIQNENTSNIQGRRFVHAQTGYVALQNDPEVRALAEAKADEAAKERLEKALSAEALRHDHMQNVRDLSMLKGGVSNSAARTARRYISEAAIWTGEKFGFHYDIDEKTGKFITSITAGEREQANIEALEREEEQEKFRKQLGDSRSGDRGSGAHGFGDHIDRIPVIPSGAPTGGGHSKLPSGFGDHVQRIPVIPVDPHLEELRKQTGYLQDMYEHMRYRTPDETALRNNLPGQA